MVTERQNEILNLYLSISLPRLNSRFKALQRCDSISSATIRNDMAALEKQGLLERPHTSSGRMPNTRAGFQYFVQNSLI